MAKVTVRNRHLHENVFPDVCARCGQPTTYAKTIQFTWTPPWTPILLLVATPVCLVLLPFLVKKRTFKVPLCGWHRRRWRWHQSIIHGGVLFFIGLVCATPAVLSAVTQDPAAPPLGLLAVGVLFVLWLLVVITLAPPTINASRITDDAITLTNMCQKFVDEFEAALEGTRRIKRGRTMDEEVFRKFSSRKPEEDQGRRYRPDEDRCRPRAEEEDDQPDERYREK